MHPTIRELGLTVATVAIFGTGCSDATSTDVSTLRGSYALRTVDSSPLPVLQWEYDYTRNYVIADTLIFDGRHTVQHVTVTRLDSIGRPYSEFHRQSYSSDYRLRGDTVEFLFRCPPNADCIAPPIAWLGPDYTLVYGYRKYPNGFGPLSLYQRVR
jgi:hypothetical protein